MKDLWVDGKEALHSCRFTSDEEVKEVVHTWLREQSKSFSTGIQKLVEWNNKCIVLQGDYVEKLYLKLLTVLLKPLNVFCLYVLILSCTYTKKLALYSCGHIYSKCLFIPTHFSPMLLPEFIIFTAAVRDLHRCMNNIHLFIIITKSKRFVV
jgi:hypothetical protein